MHRLCLAAILLASSGCEETEPDRTTDASAATTDDSASTGIAESSGAMTTAATSEAGSSTGAPLPGACDDRTDCVLHSDCCTCDALHVDETPPACDATCDRTLCEDWGITEILCSHTCLVRLVECDATLVQCMDAPPECDDGFLPSIEERCWTRHCVPAELCTPPA